MARPDAECSNQTTRALWGRWRRRDDGRQSDRLINISTVLAGERLGLKEVDDGIWLVSFMTYDLGYIDLEQKTLQTLDNPFGTRLSPMS